MEEVFHDFAVCFLPVLTDTLDKESKYYLICHHPSREVLQQILELIEKISISMYMEVPLKNTESIINEEEFSPDESELELLKDPDWISKKENS